MPKAELAPPTLRKEELGAMSPSLRELPTMADLDAALAGSDTRPILIFKYSMTCGSSAMAAEELEALPAEVTDSLDLFVVRIQRARDVSRAIEERLGVRHESPQVLLISGGKVVWHASHFRVNGPGITSAVRKHAPAAPVHGGAS
jgi:bacillithiol system protein YtxJ